MKRDIVKVVKEISRDYKKYLKLDQVFYCPNGIPNSFLNSSLYVQKNDNITVNILFLSNLIDSKGVFIFTKVFLVLC